MVQYIRYIKNAEINPANVQEEIFTVHLNIYQKKTDGKTKLTFIRRADEPNIEKMAIDYRKYITHMARLSKIDKKIYEMVAMIKKIKTSSYEPAKK